VDVDGFCWIFIDFGGMTWILVYNLDGLDDLDMGLMPIPGKLEALYQKKNTFCWQIPLHSPYVSLIYGRHIQFRFLKWPVILDGVAENYP